MALRRQFLCILMQSPAVPQIEYARSPLRVSFRQCRSQPYRFPPAARIISRAAIALLALAAAALAAGRAYGRTGAASENINLTAARSADGTSATLTWPPPTQPSYQWIFVAAKISPDAPNTTPSTAVSTYRYAGQLLLNTASTPPVSDPDTKYMYDHTNLRI